MSVVKDLVKQVDASAEIAAEVKEALEAMMELADAKVKVFESRIENDLLTGKTLDNLRIPITKVIQQENRCLAKTSDTPDTDPLKKVTESISGMIQDHSTQGIISGISSICMSVIDLMMGIGEGQEQEIGKYLVVADYPAIVRFDFWFWCRNIASASLRKQCETVFACVAYKSSVDVSKLSFNDFLSIYCQVLRAGFGDDPSKLKEMIEQAKEIYKLFTTDTALDTLSTDQAVQLVLSGTGPTTLMVNPPVRQSVSFDPL